MFIREFNPAGKTKIDKINKLLSEQFGVKIGTGFPKKEKLETVREMSNMAIVKLKGTSKQFQLEPEYAKYLGIKDVIDTMLTEGMYAESPAYQSMKQELYDNIVKLMDSGCTNEEAISQCMNDFRKDPRWSYDDEHIKPMVVLMAQKYLDEAGCASESVEHPLSSSINEFLLSELAKETGVELDEKGFGAIEEKLNAFARASGKSRDSVVDFLNGLEEDAVGQGIKFFGAKIAKENFAVAAADAEERGDKEFEYPEGSGKMHPVTIKKKNADKINKESMFDDIIDDMLAEELEGTSVEEAEVVMAVRALADDIQDHVERLGRMVNEDIPAIADQMIHEFGADKAAQFKDSAEQTLSTALESAKQAKDGVNELVGSITGEEMNLSSGGIGDLGGDDMAEPGMDDLGGDDLGDIDVNEPAAAGPEEEPLGRAPIEV